jgi:hypothetical protein
MHDMRRPLHILVILFVAWAEAGGSASAQDDARTRQLRLLCAQLSGDLTDPGGIAAFRRCMTTRDPIGEIRRDNNIGSAPADRPAAAPPAGFGRNSRRLVADGIARFQQVDAGLVYVVDAAGKLWRGTDAKDARQIDQNVASFKVVDSHLFAHGTDGSLWRAKLDGSERTLIDRTVAAFQPINVGLVYVLGTDGKLWRENGDFTKRTEVDRAVRDFQAIDAAEVFVLHADQELWRVSGTAPSRASVASKVAAFQHVRDGDATYVLAFDDTLWRKVGNEEARQVDSAVAAFQAVDQRLIYVLGKDGRLWRELGGRDEAVLVDRDVLASSGKNAFQVADPGRIFLLDQQHKLWAESMPNAR